MNKERALEVAIELAKSAIESPSNSVKVYPNKTSAEDVAAFIQTLTDRLTSM